MLEDLRELKSSSYMGLTPDSRLKLRTTRRGEPERRVEGDIELTARGDIVE